MKDDKWDIFIKVICVISLILSISAIIMVGRGSYEEKARAYEAWKKLDSKNAVITREEFDALCNIGVITNVK